MTTPFALVAATERARPGTKAELLTRTRELEVSALVTPPPIMLATLQDCRYLTDRTREVYARLSRAGVRATLFARGLTAWISPGVAGVSLGEDDPLVDEWVLVLPLAAAPAVFAARDLAEPHDDDLDRVFSYAVSHDPDVVRACRDLLVGAAGA